MKLLPTYKKLRYWTEKKSMALVSSFSLKYHRSTVFRLSSRVDESFLWGNSWQRLSRTLKINEWQQLSVSSGAFINETLHIRRARANTEMGNLSHSHILGQSGNFDQKNTPIFNYATITYGLKKPSITIPPMFKARKQSDRIKNRKRYGNNFRALTQCHEGSHGWSKGKRKRPRLKKRCSETDKRHRPEGQVKRN